MASLELQGLSKRFPDGTRVLDSLSLEIADGEFAVLAGPSGCGKSTTLRLVAGLDAPSGGVIRIGGRDVTRLSPRARDVAMVFQSYALYPHMSVAGNLGFGLRVRGVARQERERRVAEIASLLGLEQLLGRRPAQLSGGQRQRVALGRAIVREPGLFLLDEPLSNLDAGLRIRMRAELARLHRRLGATMVHVTHDQEEAMTLGQRLVVLHEGRVQQAGAPGEVYHRPTNLFVAGFIGSPPVNLLAARARGAGDGVTELLDARGGGVLARGRCTGPLPAEVVVGVRPPEVRLTAPGEGVLRAAVEVVELLGASVLVRLDAGRDGYGELRALLPAGEAPHAGEAVGVAWSPGSVHVFSAADGRRVAFEPR